VSQLPPRRPIEPLPPPPGSFDAVLGRARYRRHRRATTVLSVTAVFLAGIGGGMSIGGGVSGVRDTIASVVNNSEAPSPSPSNSAVVTPDVTPSAKRSHKPSKEGAPQIAVAPSPKGTKKIRGVAVDAAGKPIAGLYVYPGRSATEGFRATSEPVTRTAADGTFSLPCTGTPVLLAPWRVNEAQGHTAGSTWSATFVGGGTQAANAPDAPCTSAGKRVTTTVLTGSTLEGEVTVPERCEDARLSLWVWLNGNRALTVRLGNLGAGDTYSVSGLPPGQHVVGANGVRTTVTVGGGGAFDHDVTFGCDGDGPSETPEPDPSPSTPVPTPSEPPTSQPSTSTSPAPSGSGSSSPSSAGYGQASTGTSTSAP
jgi:hypothetical protein